MADVASEKRAVIYARVSSVRQAEEELPVESQIAQCRSKAEALGAVVEQVFRDDGVSGTTSNRPGFQACIEYCELTAPTYLVTWSTSRFARNRLDASLYKLRLGKAGVDLVFVSMALDRDSDGGWITEAILEVFDEFTSRQIARDTKRSMILNAQRGCYNGGPPPYGYCVTASAKRKRLAIDEAEASIVREVFDLRLQGLGAKLIAGELNRQGYRRRGRAWSKAAVHYMLRNPAVIGQTVFHRKDSRTGRVRPPEQWVVVDSHEAIIDRRTWDAVQILIGQAVDNMQSPPSAASPRSTRLFSGLLYGPDGYAMLVSSAKGRSRRYYYYDTYTHHKEGLGPPCRLAVEQMDAWLLSIVLDRILTPEFLRGVLEDLHESAGAWARENAQKQAEVTRQIVDLRARNARLYDLLEMTGRHTPNLGDLTTRLRENLARLRALEQTLSDLTSQKPPDIDIQASDAADLSQALRYIIESESDPAKTRHFLGLIIDRILLQEDSVLITYRPEVLIRDPQPVVVPSGQNWLPEPTLLGTAELVVELPVRFRRRVAYG